MENMSKQRIESLLLEERDSSKCLRVFNLPKNIVEITHWTFAHFAKNNRTAADEDTIQRNQLPQVLLALGLLEKFDELGLDGETIQFNEFMLVLEDKVITVISTPDLMRKTFEMFEELHGRLTWTTILNILGSSLTIDELKYLYTNIRFVNGGIDGGRLASFIFE